MQTAQIIVVGGGMVGAAISLGLLQRGRQVLLLERKPPQAPDLQAAAELRISALNLKSCGFLDAIGAFSYIKNLRLARYDKLSVRDELNCSNQALGKLLQKIHTTQFRASDVGQTELGYMIENSITRWGIWQALRQFEGNGLKIISDCQALEHLRYSKTGIELEISQADKSQTLQAALIIGADGANSRSRQLAGIEINQKRYAQRAMLIAVELKRAATSTTWQQFKSSGPVALLPGISVGERHYASLIWYDDANKIKRLEKLSNEELYAQVQRHFPSQAQEVHSVYQCASFELIRRHARNYSQPRLVLAGDAAHTINPLAGQGVNLGFADAELLLDKICALDAQLSDGEELAQALQSYEHSRRRQNALMMYSMDLFYHGFSNRQPMLKLARNVGLAVAQNSGILKQQVLKHALGV